MLHHEETRILYRTFNKMESNSITSLDRPWGFQEVEAPRFQDNRHRKLVRLSALRNGHLFPIEMFLLLISVRGGGNPWAIVQPERLSRFKLPTPHRESNPRPSGLLKNRRVLPFLW